MGTPGRSQRPHRQAAHKADEENQGQITAPPMGESSPIAILRNAQAWTGQGHASPSSCMPCCSLPVVDYHFNCKCAAAESQDQGGQPLVPPWCQHPVTGSLVTTAGIHFGPLNWPFVEVSGLEPRPLHCECLVLGVLTRAFPRTSLVAAFRSPQVPSRTLSFPLDKDT